MKFKIDENLPAELKHDLLDAGHDAHTVADENLTGEPDEVVLEHVRAEGRILLTLDKGIADIRTYPPNQYAGLVLFRPRTSGNRTVAAFVRAHIPTLLQSDLTGRLMIISEAGIRTR